MSAACLTLASNRMAGDRNMPQVMTSLLALEKGLRKARADGELDDVASRYGQRLQDILSEVDILLKEPNVRSDNGALIGFKDRVFGGMLPSIRGVNQMQHVTRVFNAFVRGITYFEHEALAHRHQPVYHRHGSCAPRGHDNPRCLPSNTTNTRRVKKASIEKCYIERCIYDWLWTKFVGTQDEGHLRWFENTKLAYHTCFPDVDLTVRVQYDHETNLPVGVRISAHRMDDRVRLWSVQYKKYIAMYDDGSGLYEPTVECVKSDDAAGRVYTKVSRFEAEGDWE